MVSSAHWNDVIHTELLFFCVRDGNMGAIHYLRQLCCEGYVLIGVYLFIYLFIYMSVTRLTQKLLNGIL